MDNTLSQILSPFFQGLLVATGIGLVMGLEREFNATDDEHAAGIRTFPVTAILGCVMVFIAQKFNIWVLVASIPAVFIFITMVHFITNKYKTSAQRLYAHDEANEANEGDTVRVMETRPLSKLKRWRLVEVVERAR